MATLFKDQHTSEAYNDQISKSFSQFENLNLNRSFESFKIQNLKSFSTLKNNKNAFKTDQNDCDFDGRKGDQWNKNDKLLKTNFGMPLNLYSKKNEATKWNQESSSSTNSSTLSLYIAAYEAKIEVSNEDIEKNEEHENTVKPKKNIFGKKQWKGVKRILTNGSLKYPFEIPRGDNKHPTLPELMQFKASQKLLDPRTLNISLMKKGPFNSLTFPTGYASDKPTTTTNEENMDKKQNDVHASYTMSGVLHFLQHEWSRIELERTHWEMERAELKARISFLQGERKGQENLKRDLVRRIKMLEYSLKQERLKIYRLTHNGEDPENLEDDDKPEIISDVPLDVDAVANNAEAPIWKRARLSLKQYLEELGYSDGIVNVRAFRSAKLMGNAGSGAIDSAELDSEASKKALDDTEREILDTADFLRKYNLRGGEADHSGDDYDSENCLLDDDAEKVMDEFSFLDQEKEKTSTTKKNPGSKPASNDEWRIDEKTFNRMRERFRIEQQQKRQSSLNQSSDKSSASEDSGLEHKDETHFDENQFSGNEDVDIKDDFAMNEDDSSLSVRWNLKYTLRSHYDAVRAIQFHPVEPVLITASEDGTAKLWNLNDSKLTDANKAQANNLSGIVDIEPVYTFRGHDSAILSIDMSPTGDNLYTGSLDGTICCWQVPSVNIDIHDTFDSTVLQARFCGHSDAVWSVNYQSSTNRLISASSDATIKIWDLSTLDETEYLLKTIDCNGAIPQSIDIVSTEPQQLLVAYSNKKAAILDIETGEIVLNFEFPPNEDIGDIFKILSHPTMPVTVLAGSDRKIRYFDNHTGRQIYGAVAHMEAISTLAIDPNGLYLMSGSHDGSLRIWNMEQKKCLQEIAAHRKKSDMSVLSVAFHPSRPLIGAAGADSLAKIFSSQRVIEGLSTPNEEEST